MRQDAPRSPRHTSVECVDRLYLNGYVPKRETSGQVVKFLCGCRGNRIPSPALPGHMTDDFVRRVKAYAAEHDIPIVEFERGLDSPASAEVPQPLTRAGNRFSLPGRVASRASLILRAW